MTFWQLLDRCLARLPGWPNERQWVTLGVFTLAWKMLDMAVANGRLWEVELFKLHLQGIIISAIIGMVVSFFFAANKANADEATNTAKMADAMRAQAEATKAVAPGG